MSYRSSVLQRTVAMALWVFLVGCVVFNPPRKVFLSNEELLEAIAEESDFQVDSDQFRLVVAEVREDSFLLEYAGVVYPGDRGWILRFSPKSSEQNPQSVNDLEKILAVLKEDRREFEVRQIKEESLSSAALRYAEYQFRPQVRDVDGKLYQGRGIAGVLTRTVGDAPVVYTFRLDNWWGRPDLTRYAVQPFIEEMLK